jgi:hypothetical protein
MSGVHVVSVERWKSLASHCTDILVFDHIGHFSCAGGGSVARILCPPPMSACSRAMPDLFAC